MKAFLLYISLLLCTFSLSAQTNIDSLMVMWNNNSLHDTVRLEAMHKISWGGYLYSNPDSCFYFAQKQYDFAKEKNLKKYQAGALNTQGVSFWARGNFPKAIEYYNKSYQIKKEIGDISGMGSSLNNIGLIYKEQGNIAKAIEYYTKALKIKEKVGDKNNEANILANIGQIHLIQGDYKKGLLFYKKSLRIKKEINGNGIGTIINNIGGMYSALKDYEKAADYYNQSLVIHKKNEDLNGVSVILSNISELYLIEEKYDLALDFCEQSLKIKRQIKSELGIGLCLENMAAIYQEKNDFKKAIEYAKKSLKIATKIGAVSDIMVSNKILYECYRETGNLTLALDNYTAYIAARDSLNNQKNQKEVVRQEMQYAFDKEEVVRKKEDEKELAISKAQKKQQKLITYAIAIGLSLVILFSLFIVNRLRITKKQKQIIEEQKLLVDEKNQEITDSIAYAKRIQTAILPPIKIVKEYLKQSFILYQPKDIVAGDFYWMEIIGEKVLFAAADCTGHGVPGAMVSVVCNNALNRSVREYGLISPGEILDKTRQIVIEEFEKSEEEVKDGMDIALCSIEGDKLQYAGAHNPLWIIRKGEIIEIKANKQPIGQFDDMLPYTTHNFDLQTGDSIYIFSDGFADQFGGEKGKKFKSKPFKELLLSIQDKSMDEQKEFINSSFGVWKGELEQVDDICIIGVRI